MKIEISNKKVYFDYEGVKEEIHPFWLRERINGDKYVDQKTQQRLFDPVEIFEDTQVDRIKISNGYLEVSFKDGTFTKLSTNQILKEFSKYNKIKFTKKIKVSLYINSYIRLTISLFSSLIIDKLDTLIYQSE